MLWAMNPAHWLFDKLYPAIRFTYEQLQGHPWFDRIAPQLWVGGAPTYDRDHQFLLDNQIDAVLDMRAEREGDRAFYKDNDINYKRIEVLDVTVPDTDQLTEAIDWVDEQIDDGRTVLVHCAKGRGRSAIVVAGYLMRENELTFDEARGQMEAIRPLTKLESRHQRRLAEWQVADQTTSGSGFGA